jgi:hypothetical protein
MSDTATKFAMLVRKGKMDKAIAFLVKEGYPEDRSRKEAEELDAFFKKIQERVDAHHKVQVRPDRSDRDNPEGRVQVQEQRTEDHQV